MSGVRVPDSPPEYQKAGGQTTSRFVFVPSGSYRLEPRNFSPSIAIAPSNPSDKTPQIRALRSRTIAHEPNPSRKLCTVITLRVVRNNIHPKNRIIDNEPNQRLTYRMLRCIAYGLNVINTPRLIPLSTYRSYRACLISPMI